MAVGGDLQSSFPTQGINPKDVELIGTANHAEIAALPNEDANVIVVDESGQQLSPSAVLDGFQLGAEAGSSQDTLAAPSGADGTTLEKDGKAAPDFDLEKQRAALPDGLEIKLDFSSVDLVTRQALILKCAQVLLAFGAPSHRIEADLEFAAEILAVPAQFVHNPNCVGMFWLPAQ
jgi:hypothetical protein